MKLFIELLKWIGCGALLYPLLLACAYFDSGANIGTWFWLEILIIDIVVSLLLFLFIDFKLIKRIKSKKHN